MSGKKSWDIAPARKRPKAASPQPAPAPAARATERARPAARVEPVVGKRPAPTRRQALPTAPLAERRRGARRARVKAIAAILLVASIVLGAVTWIPAFRISTVAVRGADTEAVTSIVRSQIEGSYAFLIPRDSIFVYPESRIQSAILAANPELEMVTLSRSSFSEISVDATARARALVWCGTDQAALESLCYYGDTQGRIFSKVEEGAATSTDALPVLYAPLSSEGDTGPIGQYLAVGPSIEGVLAMVRAIEAQPLPVAATVLRGDEVDIALTNGTRIVYLLGQEQQAAAVAQASLPGLDLASGGYAYVDLRFDGKAYAMPRMPTP